MSDAMLLIHRWSMVALLALAVSAHPALAQQPGAPPQYVAPPYGAPPQQGFQSQPGFPQQGFPPQQPYGAPQGMPPQPYGAAPPAYGSPQPYGGVPGAAPMPGGMPGGTWSWPPQGSAWPVQPGAQETVAPDAGQSQPLTPGVPTQTHVPGFVRKPTLQLPPPPQSDSSQPQFGPPQ